jgi:hypothetical protein
MDVNELPEQPADTIGMTEAEPAAAPQAPQGVVVPAQWSSITEEQKNVHIQTLIVMCVDNIYRNNPALWIWSPQGAKDEIGRIWVERMTSQLNTQIDPNDPVTQLYFPDIKEDPNVQVPSLYTRDQKVGNDLLQFTRQLAALGEVDLNNIHEAIGLDIPSMKGLLLFWRIGMPAMLKKIDQQTSSTTPSGHKVSAGGIIIPGM